MVNGQRKNLLHLFPVRFSCCILKRSRAVYPHGEKLMKRWILLVVLILLAVPALAQDAGGDSGSDLFDLSSLGNFGNLPPEFDPLLEVRNLLLRANAPPMDKKQEKDLKRVYDKEVKVLEKTFETRFGIPLKPAMGTLQAQASARGGRGGRRGATPARRETPQIVEARRHMEQLLDKVIAVLRIEQQGPVRRYQSEQIRLTKLNALTNSMATAGTPLTPAQLTEVESILARESRLRALIIVEAKGASSRTEVTKLEAQTNERLVAVLDPPQRITYAETTTPVTAPRAAPATPRRPNE